MLEKFQKIARMLAPLSLFAASAMVVFAVLFALNILQVPPVEEGDYLIPISMGFLWALFVYSFIGGFREIPQPRTQDHGFLARLKGRWLRGLYWMLAALTFLITIGVVVVTVRLIGVWR